LLAKLEALWEEGKPTRRGYLIAQCLANAICIFHPDPENPRRVKGFVGRLETTDEEPVIEKPRKSSELQKAFMDVKFKIMGRRGQVEPATGPYASALMLVPYNDRIQRYMQRMGDRAYSELRNPENEAEVATFYRVTVDMRRVNSKTIPDVFPLPRIDDLLDRIPKGAKHFSIFDCADAFWTVELDKRDRPKTGFRTHNDHLQSTVIPQGGKRSANTWARVVAETFADMPDVIVYQDDILVCSTTFEEHFQAL
jgi:hypothetical protein